MKKIKLWWWRNFKIISTNDAIKANLIPYENIHGDLINILNCRSIWKDNKNRKYRIDSLAKDLIY
jgi:hypothetical protein